MKDAIWKKGPKSGSILKSSHIPSISQFVVFPLVSLDHCNAQVNNTGHHVKGNWGHCSYDCPLQDPLKEADDDRWWCSGRYVISYLMTAEAFIMISNV